MTDMAQLKAALENLADAIEKITEAGILIGKMADDIGEPVDPPAPDGPPAGQSMPFADVNDARADFRQRYGAEPADCDPNDSGLWVCHDRKVGSNADTVIDDPVPPPNPGTGEVIVRKVPRQADGTWKYNTNSHDALFSGYGPSGEPRQWFAFWADNERLHICQRDLPFGEFEEAVDIHSDVCGSTPLEWDSHNSIAVGQCPQTRRLFVTGNHHSDRLNLGISIIPGTIFGGFDRFDDKRIDGDTYHGRMTYPSLTTVGLGDAERLVLSVRDQRAGQGLSRFKWSVMVWNHETERFHSTHLNTGLDLRLYASRMARDPRTGHVWLSCIWRDETGNGWRHLDHWVMWSPDGRDWYQHEGYYDEEVTLPLIWKGTSKTWRAGIDHLPAGHEPPVLIWDTSDGDPEPNSTNGQGSLVIGNDGNPHITHASKDGRTWHTWFDGQWRHSVLPYTPHSEEPIPYGDGAGLLVHSDTDEVWFVDLAHESPRLTLGNRISKGGLNGGVSIVSDAGAQRQGYVSYAVTTVRSNRNDQYRKKPRPADHDADVYIITVAMSDLQTAEGVVL